MPVPTDVRLRLVGSTWLEERNQGRNSPEQTTFFTFGHEDARFSANELVRFADLVANHSRPAGGND